jgi:hypothetical protein
MLENINDKYMIEYFISRNTTDDAFRYNMRFVYYFSAIFTFFWIEYSIDFLLLVIDLKKWPHFVAPGPQNPGDGAADEAVDFFFLLCPSLYSLECGD